MNIKIKVGRIKSYSNREEYTTENIFLPGEKISNQEKYFFGNNTFINEKDLVENQSQVGIYSSVVGEKVILNNLMYVRCPHAFYPGKIGDTVVGRIVEVHKNRWMVDINALRTSMLNLTGVKLPDGDSRRRSEEDEKVMRQYLDEGDLVVAEIREMYSNNLCSLMIRDKGQGKLGQGMLINVPCELIFMQKRRTHLLPCGMTLILGCNGYIWLGPTRLCKFTFHMTQNEISTEEYQIMIRIANCIQLLAVKIIPLSDETVNCAYDLSIEMGFEVSHLQWPEVMDNLSEKIILHLGTL